MKDKEINLFGEEDGVKRRWKEYVQHILNKGEKKASNTHRTHQT